MSLRSIHELTVSEAYRLLLASGAAGGADLPPLDAIENEDWGRDWLLSRLWELPEEELARMGLAARLDSTPPGADDSRGGEGGIVGGGEAES